MKVEVKQIPTINSFPILLKSKQTELIILATTDTSELKIAGTVIQNNNTFNLGEYSEDWDKRFFEPFIGTITLSN